MDRFLIFAGGVVSGIVVSYLVLTDYFEKREEEERKFLTAHYEKKLAEARKQTEPEQQPEEAEQPVVVEPVPERPPADTGVIMEGHRTVSEYHDYTSAYKRSNIGMSGYSETMHPDDDDDDPMPRPISPTELEKHIGYANVMLKYFTEDEVLADDRGNVYDVDSTIGPDGLKSIGKYEPDTGYITDEAIRVDYIIERVDNSYEDAFVFI